MSFIIGGMTLMDISDLIVALISGAFTMIAIYITIRYERKKEEKNNRLQIMPYLTYKYIDHNNDERKKEHEDVGLSIRPKSYEKQLTIDQYVSGYLVIKNIGLNSAIETNILQVDFDDLKIYQYREINAIEVGNSCVVAISVIPPLIKELKERKISSMPIKILIGYSDLFDYYYEQIIELSLGWAIHQLIDDEHNIVSEDYSFECGINNISRPIIYKDKNIKQEKFKRIDAAFNTHTK